MNITNTPLIKEAIQKSGFTLAAIAEKMGISPSALSHKCNGNRGFKPAEIITFCKTLNITDGNQMRAIFFDEQRGDSNE